jgi:hypothetical protein
MVVPDPWNVCGFLGFVSADFRSRNRHGRFPHKPQGQNATFHRMLVA